MKKLFLIFLSLYMPYARPMGPCLEFEPDLMKSMLKVVSSLEEEDPFYLLYKKEKSNFKKTTYVVPYESNSSTAKYRFPPLELKPGDAVYLQVPENLTEREILFMVLGHRQNPSNESGWDASKKWDANPGLLSVQVNQCSPTMESKWRYWDGMSSGDQGAKFAEVSYSMELEGLYEWYKNGHVSIKDESVSHDPLCVNGIRVVNVGKDVVELGELAMKVTGPKASEFKEVNFSSSNKFGDYVTAKGREYGSRNDALSLGGYSKSSATLPSGWKVEGNELQIDPPVGKKLSSLEVTVGDEHEDGTSGYSRLTAGVRKADGSVEWFIKSENIPPLGVLLGSPLNEDYVLQEGDKIIIRAESDEAFVTGVRYGIQ